LEIGLTFKPQKNLSNNRFPSQQPSFLRLRKLLVLGSVSHRKRLDENLLVELQVPLVLFFYAAFGLGILMSALGLQILTVISG